MILYLDDVRECPYLTDALTVRTPDDFKAKVTKHIDDITVFSLDHDLGCDPETGYTLLKWLADNFDLRNKTIVCHSANPVGKANIDNYVGFLRQHRRL